MTVTLPADPVPAEYVIVKNFLALQSGQLAVSGTSNSITFSALTGANTVRVSAKISNTGTSGCYIASGKTTATAVTSSSTPSPSSGTAISNCDYIGPGVAYVMDFVPGTDTFAAITASGTTTLEFSVGWGQ